MSAVQSPHRNVKKVTQSFIIQLVETDNDDFPVIIYRSTGSMTIPEAKELLCATIVLLNQKQNSNDNG